MKLVELKNVYKQYKKSEQPVVKSISLEISECKLIFFCGPSGVGKSTILHIIGLMDRPTQGDVYFLDQLVSYADQNKLAYYRINYIGFMFQYHYLLDTLNVKENILLPYWMKIGSVKNSVLPEYIEILGISHLLHRYPFELSGGEQQKVALARAMINNPKLLIADEPTGNLDHNNAVNLIELIRKFVDIYKMTAVVATHNLELTKYGNIVYYLEDGKIVNVVNR